MTVNIMVTPGGSGTWALDAVLRPHIFKIPNTHQRNPKLDIENARVIYVYANPYNIILSYLRRGFLKTDYAHVKHMNGNVAALKHKNSWGLEEFLDLENDPFNLEGHFMGWHDYNDRNYDIMFVKYESLDKSIFKICDWFEISKLVGQEFEFKPRHSSWQEQSKEVQEELDKMFGKLKKFQDNLDDCVVKIRRG